MFYTFYSRKFAGRKSVRALGSGGTGEHYFVLNHL